MKIIGFNFSQNDFRYCVLEGQPNPPTIIEKNKINYPQNFEIPELMEWFETQLSLIIDRHHPDKLSHKTSINLSTVIQIQQSCFPQGILNLIAKKKNIPINFYTSQGINATKFGLPQKTDVFAYLDTLIGTHPPHWDRATKEAVLVAWFNLL